MLPKQQICAHQIRRQAPGRNGQHPAGFNLGRIEKTVISLIEDVKRYQHKKNAVQQRRQDLDPVEAVGLRRRGAPARKVHGEKTETERGNIREHVTRVRQQRE